MWFGGYLLADQRLDYGIRTGQRRLVHDGHQIALLVDRERIDALDCGQYLLGLQADSRVGQSRNRDGLQIYLRQVTTRIVGTPCQEQDRDHQGDQAYWE